MLVLYICLILFALGLALILFIYLKVEILIELLPAENKSNDKSKKLLIQLKPLFRPFRQSLHYRFDSQLKLSVEDICKKAALFISDLQQYDESGYFSRIGIFDVVLAGYKKLQIEKLEWKTVIGLENAMDTAICTGGLWAIKGSFIGLISARSRLEEIKIEVQPDFSEIKLASHLDCIVKMRTVHIMIIVVRLLLHSFIKKDRAKRKRASIKGRRVLAFLKSMMGV
jgi:hypothetical protein